MELFYLKFPILIHLLNNKAKHIVLSEEEIPINHYFKIIRSGVNPDNADFLIEGEYTVIEEENDQSPSQENIESSKLDSKDDGAGEVIENSSGTSL